MYRTNENEFLARMKSTTHSSHARSHYTPESIGPRNRFIHAFTTTDFNITDIRKLWRDWLALHTINPDEVLARGFVHRSEEMYTITYESMEIEKQFSDGSIRYKTIIINGKRDLYVTMRTVQLESSPLIFPYLAIDRIIHERQMIETENNQT
jgi:hypothetical protein